MTSAANGSWPVARSCDPSTSLTMIQAILFDLDGTLIDTERLWVEATQTAMQERGADFSYDDSLKLVYGRAWRDIYIDLHARWPEKVEAQDVMEAELSRRIAEIRQAEDITIPGSLKLLRRLAQDYPIAIVSGSPRNDIAHAVTQLELTPLIQFYLGSEDYQAGKPDPAPYLAAAEQMPADPATCLVFEDSHVGVASARAAGMKVVGLQRPDAPRQDLAAADCVLPDLAQFEMTCLETR